MGVLVSRALTLTDSVCPSPCHVHAANVFLKLCSVLCCALLCSAVMCCAALS